MLRVSDLSQERRHGGGCLPDAVLTVSFYLLFLVQLVHHNLWRDEVNAFGLALASPTLGSLFDRVRYEGHPWLWYFVLWVLSRITTSVVALKILEACVVAVTYGLLGMRSPFSRVEKALIFCGYFISFEYAVLCRMYSLLLLFMLVYLWRRSGHPEQVVVNCALLGLLPNSDIMGLILSVGLLAEYAFSLEWRMKWRVLIRGLAVYTMAAGFAIWSARPAQDMGWRTTGHPFAHVFDGAHLVASGTSFVVMPFLPVGFGRQASSFWNPEISNHPGLYLACLPVILFAHYTIFRSHKNLRLFISFMLVFSTMFGHLVFVGTMRHWGVTFLGFLAALWMLKRDGGPLPTFALLLLGISAAGGIYTAYAQWQRPFSNAGPAAMWLRAHHSENTAIVGTPDTTVASLAVLLHRPIYMLDCDCSDRYVLFSRRRDGFSRIQIPDRLLAARRRLGSELLYIDAYPLTQELRQAFLERGMSSKELSRMTRSTFSEEDFYIYWIGDAGQ